MRDIEFRGKCIDNGEWAWGSLIKTEDDEYLIARFSYGLELTRCSRGVIPETVGQYTGLKDKNGVKIFEGDILHDELWKIGVVEFNKGRFIGNFDGRTFYTELHFDAATSKVIGNIHDNPKLLPENDF